MGTDPNLVDVVLSEDGKGDTPQRTGARILNVHVRSRKLALALCKIADWYYDRVHQIWGIDLKPMFSSSK